MGGSASSATSANRANADGDGIPRVAKIERPDAKHEHVADDDVEGSPSHVNADRGGATTLSDTSGVEVMLPCLDR